jgi:hypothetical protein
MSRKKAVTPVTPAPVTRVTPSYRPLPAVATQLRRVADLADKGELQGLALVVMHASGVETNIADPCGAERLTLAGAIGQLHHMLQASEHNDRMASLAARMDPGPNT